MIKQIIKVFVAVLLIPVIVGCSFFAPYKQRIRINGTPSDATVVVNGNIVAVPAEIDVPRNKNLTIIVHKDGFEPYNVTAGYSLSTIGAVDVIGLWFFLLPGIGLLSPGAWELMQDNFYYTLSPVKK